MTISSNIRKAGPFVGNGTASTFAFTFKVFQAADLEVVRLNVATTIETILVINSDYTVSLNADQNSNPGGSITLTAGALASGFNLVITSDIENLQPTDIVNQGGFYPDVIEDALDRATIQIQQLQEAVDRSAKLPITSSADADALVADIVALANDQVNIDLVAANIGDINTVADDIENVNTVATDIADVNTVAENIADVTTAADNIAAIIAAPTEASDAAASASLANEWATKTSGPVAGGEYSAKYNAQQAATSALNASDSADDALAAQTAAEAARDQTLTAFDNFDDRYLGTKSSDPTVDNDGNPLVAGALYFNSVDGVMKVYTGSAWVAAYVSGTDFLAKVNNLSDLPNKATARTNLGVAIGSDVQAFDADTAKTDVPQTFTAAQRGGITTLTDGATITPDFAVANNFQVTLGGNRTLANPTNLVAGQSGVIRVVQDGTGSRTLAYGSNWKFSNGTAPSLTTTAAAVDVLVYFVENSTRITARLVSDTK